MTRAKSATPQQPRRREEKRVMIEGVERFTEAVPSLDWLWRKDAGEAGGGKGQSRENVGFESYRRWFSEGLRLFHSGRFPHHISHLVLNLWICLPEGPQISQMRPIRMWGGRRGDPNEATRLDRPHFKRSGGPAIGGAVRFDCFSGTVSHPGMAFSGR